MHVSVLLIALMQPGAAPSLANPSAPAWQDSYKAAREVGREVKKPLAVFIGSGPAGWEKLANEGKLSPRHRQLLNDHFVCLYLNLDVEEQRPMAKAFDVTTGTGLVLSTREGNSQAFFHHGTLSHSELEDALVRHAHDRVLQKTEVLERVRTSYYYSSEPAIRLQTTIPTVYSTMVVPTTYASYTPSMTFAPQPTFAPAVNFAPAFAGYSGIRGAVCAGGG
jgi:hypothetical protein